MKKMSQNVEPYEWFREVIVDGYQCLVHKVIETDYEKTYYDIKICTQAKGGGFMYGIIECEDATEMDILFETIDEKYCAEVIYKGMNLRNTTLN
jgi:hypothetical protein